MVVKGFRRLAGVTLVATLALVAVGGLVRASDSGLGCLDSWPKCRGVWIPPAQTATLIEFSHRLLAATVVVLIGVMAFLAIRSHRDRPGILWGSVTAAVLVIVQSLLGAVVVKEELKALLVAVHFATAMLLVGSLVYVFIRTYAFEPKATNTVPKFVWLTRLTLGVTFLLISVGAYVRGSGAWKAFTDWPLMNGKLIPGLGGIDTIQFLHRLLAASVGVLVAYLLVRARTLPNRSKVVVNLTTVTMVLLVCQIAAGALLLKTALSTFSVTLHVTLSGLVWASVVAVAMVSEHLVLQPVTEQVPTGDEPSFGETAAAYFQLMKPRIIVLLLITTVPAMVLAEARLPSLWLVLATLFGGTLAAGSANAINCYIDRDIDLLMRRTRRRPVPSHKVTPDQALAFGFILGTISFYFLAIAVNVMAAELAVGAIVFYVLVYTLWLKRRTEQNIVIGGAAGAVPALVGWAAVTGHIAAPSVMLFAIIFVWTPPHFWALAMKYENDYAAAGIPMMPVVRGREGTATQILVYSLGLFMVTLVTYPVAHMGQIYLASAVTLGGIFIFKALKLKRSQSQADAWGLFKYSILYLALLFAAVAVDGLVGRTA